MRAEYNSITAYNRLVRFFSVKFALSQSSALLVSSALFASVTLIVSVAGAGIVDDVRDRIAANDFAGADRKIAEMRKAHGASPELAQAISWMGRGELAAKDFDKAESYAEQARKMSLETLGNRKLDSDPWLPLAL